MDQKSITKNFKTIVDLNYVFNFGQFKGFSFCEVVKKKPLYIIWLIQKNIVNLTDDAENELLHSYLRYKFDEFEKDNFLASSDTKELFIKEALGYIEYILERR